MALPVGYIEGPDGTDTSQMDEDYFTKLLGLSPSWKEVHEVIDRLGPEALVLRHVSNLCERFGIESERAALKLYKLAVQKQSAREARPSNT